MGARRWGIRAVSAAVVMAAALGAASSADAASFQLGFILDRSGSIGSTNWSTIVTGLANAIDEIPVGSTDTYQVSVVTFATTASANIVRYDVTDLASRQSLQLQVQGLAAAFTGGSTNMAAAFSTMQTTLGDMSGFDGSYVNFATDGVPNDATAAIAARNNLITAGVDNISIEGIGAGINTAFLQGQLCYPQPCDTATPFNFPTQGFYLGIDSVDDYETAMRAKIRVVTRQVPEPMTVTLVGAGIMGLLVRRRRRAA